MFGSEGFDLDCSRVAAGRGDYVETKGTRHERHARDARVGGRPGRERPVPFTAVYYDGEGLRDGRAVGHLASDEGDASDLVHVLELDRDESPVAVTVRGPLSGHVAVDGVCCPVGVAVLRAHCDDLGADGDISLVRGPLVRRRKDGWLVRLEHEPLRVDSRELVVIGRARAQPAQDYSVV